MPGGNQAGPMGQGSMTGRGAGYCGGFTLPGCANPGKGRGYARGLGCGMGFGFGRTRGRGRANRFRMFGLGGWIPGWRTTEPAPMGKDQETQILKAQSQQLQQELEGISQRLEELENE